MMHDPVFIIATVPMHPMFCGVVHRFIAEIMIQMYGSQKIKVSEIDASVKSEYKKFLRTA